MTLKHIVAHTALWLVLLMLGSANRAAAGGFETARFGSEYGYAAGSTPFGVYYNPAALTGTRKVHLAVDVSLLLHQASYKRTDTTTPAPADAPGVNLGTSKLFDVAPLPSLAGAVHFGDFTIGAGVYAPISGLQRWGGNDAYKGNTKYPGAQDGAARWHLLDGDLIQVNVSLAVAYRIPVIRLSVGGGLNLNYMRIRLSRALTAAQNDDPRYGVEQRVVIQGDTFTGSYSAGVMWEAIENKLWLAASYQSPPGFYTGMQLEGTTRTSVGSVSENPSTIHQKFPDIIRWAVRTKPNKRYELRLFGDYSRWSRLKQQCVTSKGANCDLSNAGTLISNQVRKWKDTVGVRAGASYFLDDRKEAFFGVGYDSSAIPGTTLDASIVDGHDISATLGGRMRLGEMFGLLASYTHQQMLPRTITNSELDSTSWPIKNRLPTANGEYKQWIGYLTIMGELYFD
jgi:long-chain fatty acid transport protein